MNRTFITILTVSCSTIELQGLNIIIFNIVFKINFLGDKRFELLKHYITIEFTAQPFLPIKEPSLIIIKGI